MRGLVSSISPPGRSLQQRPLAGLRRNVVREIPGRNVRERAPAAAAVRGAGARDFSRGSLGSRYDRRYGLAGRGVCLTAHGASSSGSRAATRRLGVGSGSGRDSRTPRGTTPCRRQLSSSACRAAPAVRLFGRERVAEATYLYMEDAQSSVPGRGRTRTVQGGLPRVFGDRLRALGCRDFPAEQ
jgi:hypothetical protein